MGLKIIFLTLALCTIIVSINCERFNDCTNCRPTDYVKGKGAKYYSNSPQRFYRRPPMIQAVKGIFSYTPPPNYMKDNNDQSSPFRPSKVSKRREEGMPDEDINNIIKYMSKKDLDKLVEMAEKEKYIDKFKNPERNERDERTKPGSDIYMADVQEIEADNFNPHLYDDRRHNYVKESTETKLIYMKPPTTNKEYRRQQSNFDYQGINPNINYVRDSSKVMYPNPESQRPNKFTNLEDLIDYGINAPNSNNMKGSSTKINYPNIPNIQYGPIRTTYTNLGNYPSLVHNTGLDMNEINQYFNFVQNFNDLATKDGHIFTDSSIMKEEELPRPVNLREEEYVVSHTMDVPTVVEADSSYDVENFGELPLMNYENSKLNSVSSYNVPHYTVSTIIWLLTIVIAMN